MNKIKQMPFLKKKTEKKYITWINRSNSCWLDASMAIIAHNSVLKKISEPFPESRINEIIKLYEEAIDLLNTSEENINLVRLKLDTIQISNSGFLKPILKYQIGDPESAFCTLLNLLKDDLVIKKKMEVSFIKVKDCIDCGAHHEAKAVSTFVTLQQVDIFDPLNPLTKYMCPCNRSEQNLKLIYVSLPPCIIFHLEYGLGKKMPPLSFTALGRKYHLTALMTREKGKVSKINHYVTYIRDPFENQWLDCNDLNIDIIHFSPVVPSFKLEEISILVYESYDNFGTITDDKYKKVSKESSDVEYIDLDGDKDAECKTVSPKISPNLQDNTLYKKIDSESRKASILTGEKSTLPKKVIHSSVMQSLQTNNYNERRNNTESLRNEEPDLESARKKERSLKINKLKQNINLCDNTTKQTTDQNDFPVIKTSEMSENYVNMKMNDSILDKKSSENLYCSTSNSIIQKNLYDDSLALNSKSEQEDKEAFLSNAATNTSGTSYVLCTRRKKKSGVQLNEKRYLKNALHQDSESSSKLVRNSIRSKRRTVEDKDSDYVPSSSPRKMQKIRALNNRRQSQNEKDKIDSVEDVSKLMNPDSNSDSNADEEENLEEQLQLYSNQQMDADSDVENPNINNSAGKVLEKFEKVWACHDPNCNCDSVDDEERIDSIIKYSFAYFCKLSSDFKNA